MDEIIRNLTYVEQSNDPANREAGTKISALLTQVAAVDPAEYRRLTDLYWATVDEARKEQAPEPWRLTKVPTRATSGRPSRERGRAKNGVNYAERVVKDVR